MRIGIDLDGVIFDSEKLYRIYSELYDIQDLKKNSLKNNKEINAGKPHEYWKCKKITKNFKKNEKSACILFFVII